MKDLQAVILAAVLLLPVALGAGTKDVVSPLIDEHWNAAHTVSLKTPAGWTVTSKPGDLELRILRRQGELGLDSLHVDYEYDAPIEGEKGATSRSSTTKSPCASGRTRPSPFGK